MFLTDQEIQALIGAPKPRVEPERLLERLNNASPSNGHRRTEQDVLNDRGQSFTVKLRQSSLRRDDFSVLLVYRAGTVDFILRRYNGPSHPHRNKIEGDDGCSFRPHRHEATERYQQRGFRAEGYAEPRDDYFDVASALVAMLAESGFAGAVQGRMF